MTRFFSSRFFGVWVGARGVVCRGGRGDRTGRYGSSSNNHNFRDMDYRGYEQEDEETEAHGFYACDDRPSDVPDFRERPAFPLRGDGPQEPGDVDKCGPWPPCHQPQPATASRPFPLRMERPPRFEHPVRTGLLERPRGKDVRGFTESTAPVPGNRDGNWGATGSHSDGTEFHPARQQDEDRFSRDTAKRRVSRKPLRPSLTTVRVFFYDPNSGKVDSGPGAFLC